jgi:hypothetical protein
MVIKTGIASLTAGINNAYSATPSVFNQTQIGIVFGVITTPNTPSPELYKNNGGEKGIGTIFYLPYTDANKNKKESPEVLVTCTPAKPLFSFVQDYPLPGEQVILFSASSPDSQNSSAAVQTYYLPSINLWNNIQQNSAISDEWKTFIQNEDIRNLLAFEGDRIYQGRKGNGIRLGTTVKEHSDLNEWSSTGNDGDPITIMVNGYITTDTGSLIPNVEEINKEMSSLYMTSTQTIPLIPGASIINPRVNTVKPKDYTYSQFIANSDRITLNSKRDEILLFSKTNIELNSDNIININAGITHINSPSINLGTKSDGSYPTEAVLLGNQTMYAFDILIGSLSNLASSLTTAATQDGPIVACHDAGVQLFSDLQRLCNQLEKCLSTKVHTV